MVNSTKMAADGLTLKSYFLWGQDSQPSAIRREVHFSQPGCQWTGTRSYVDLT
jgi:hypothetical protein